MNRFIFGFLNFHDLVTTVFSKSWWTTVAISSLVTWCSAAAGFIHGDARVVYGLFYFMFLDWITGVLKSLKHSQFNSFTFQRFFFNLIARFSLIACAHHMSSWYDVLSILHLQDVLVIGFILVEFISITENLAAIDARIVPSKMQKYLSQITDLDTVAARLWPGNTTPETSQPDAATPPQTEPAVPAAAGAPMAELELVSHQ